MFSSNRNKLKTEEGIPHPPNVNPDALCRRVRKSKKKYSADEYVEGRLWSECMTR